MLLPRFSIRTLLVVFTAFAVLALFAGHALGGRAWALGLAIAALSVPAALAVHAAFFGFASLMARWLGPAEIVSRTSRGGVERTVMSQTPTPAPTVDRQIVPTRQA